MSEVEAVANTSEKTEEKPAEPVNVEKAYELLAQGKRNILCGEVPDAVNQFQEATKLLAEKFGETAKECGDAYLCYGKSLLEMSRMESGVLGNALQGIEEEEEEEEESESKSESSEEKIEDAEKISEEEREKISIDVYDAMAERDEEKKQRIDKEKAKRKEDGEEEEMETETKPEEGEESEKKEETEEKEDEKKETDKKEEKAEAETKETDEKKVEEKETKVEEKKEEAEKKVEEKDGDKKEEKSEEKVESEKKDEEMEAESEDKEKKKTDEDTATEAESEELNTEEEGEGEKEDTEGTEGEEGAEGKEGEEKKEEEDDVSNLQLAWEVLELAKNIFIKEDTKESKTKLAEAHLKLGEVALETEQYETAVGDFKDCLEVQQGILDKEDRCLAETHYQLGLAYTFATLYDEAISNYKSAASVMETKINSLEKVISDGEKEGKGKDIADFEDPVYKAHKEIKELKEILPDILAKIEDVTEEQKTAETAKQMVKEAVGLGAAAGAADKEAAGEGPSTSEDKPANVITHLVRKKRKTEAEGEESTEEPKKAKIENGSGDAPMNGSSSSPEKNGAEKETPKAEAAMETEEVKTKTVQDVKEATEAAQKS